MEQVHGNSVVCVGKENYGKIIKECDGLVTNDPGATLSVRVADCLPIFFYSPSTESIGLVHAGWRGLQKGIIKKTLNLMFEKFGSKPGDTTIYVGPHICVKHYEVKSDVAQFFSDYPDATTYSHGKIYLNLGKVAQKQLTDFGVKKNKIKFDDKCTFEEVSLDSYRRGSLVKRTRYLFRLPESS